ncbi:glycosyltransferase family 2 protein [Candidatus Parcubacteria bacterium]|nr:MAG: glycosyltransferase family 2 protein [Candidatus Parcubacteria bacterium]
MSYDISIIIVNWKVRALLEKCLDSILANKDGLNLEIYVVDNDSKDGTSEMIMMEYPEVKVIAMSRNLGFAKANNLAIKQAKGKYIFLLNPDTQIKAGFFAKIFSYMETNPDVGIVGPKILNEDGSVQFSVRRSPDMFSQILIMLKLKNILVDNKFLKNYLWADFDYNKEQEVAQIMGAAMVIRREVFEQIGFFDEGFFVWFEEVDFCHRAKKHKIKIKYFPGAELYHVGGKSFGQKSVIRKQFIFDKSLLYYFLKHKPIWQLIIIALIVPINILLTIAYAIYISKKRP